MRSSNQIILWIGAFAMIAGVASGATRARDSSSRMFLREESEGASELMLRSWKTGDGLPANEIEDLRETPDGFLWMGTPQGLVRFDGVRFDVFFNVPTGLRYGTRVNPLEVDASGKLWVAPDETGLIYLEGGRFTEGLTNGASLQTRAVSLCSDGSNGVMWIDSEGNVGRINSENPDEVQKIKGAGASASSRWVRDSDGKLWMANSRNLKIYEQGKWRDVPVPGNASMTVAPRQEGGLWIAREAKLRFVTADGYSRELATFPWVGQSRVTSLLEDRRGRLWIGTVGQGLFSFSNGKFQQVLPTGSSILCLLEDSQNNLWVGTRGSGLVRVRQRQFFMHDLRTGLDNEFVRSLAADKEGRLWILTAEGGIGFWQNGSWTGLNEKDGWPGHDSAAVLPGKDGVWISTFRRGIWRWANGKVARVDLGPRAPKEPASDLLEDQRGRFWMVTDNSGIFCWETNKVTRYTARTGLPSQYLRRIIEGENGDVWAGDWEGAIVRFRNQRWETMRPASGHRDAVRSMLWDNGALWIGTSAGGLLRLKDGQTARISTDEGLPDTGVQQLLLDGRGSLWGGTSHKLFRVSLEHLNALADGHRQTVHAITYGRGDGLPDVSFANWSDPRCDRTDDGELWFATANGAIHFQPANLIETKPPQVLLQQTFLNGKPIDSAALQHLRPEIGRVEFRFTAPCLTAPERVRFRYQLTGVDTEWVDAVGRSATYASIPAGHHEFKVLASSPEGIWSSEPATVALAVHPFFWQTNWFLASLAAIVAGGGVGAVRLATVRRLKRRLDRLRQEHAVDRERARIAHDIHDELGANLTSIGLLADLGTRHKADPVAVSHELDQISQAARESVAAMDAIVWALNPRNDSLDNFANYIAQFTREFFRPTNLRTRLDLPANLPEHRLATETRHQLFLLVKESFNNIVRHAQATEVHLHLACANGQLRLVVGDNGRGLSAETRREGCDGLKNLRHRIEALGGSMRIESENGQGARLEFVLPLTNVRLN